MRPAIAVVLALVFAVLFIVALTASRVVNTVGDPAYITGVLDEVDTYDFIYDELIDAALTDLTTQGVRFDNGVSGQAQTITFDEPEKFKAAAKKFIDTVAPREYSRRKIAELLNGLIPYATGRSDEFTIDLETQARIEAIPEAVRLAAAEIGLGELLTRELIAPAIRDLSGSLTDEALGFSFTPDEAEAAARRILPPEWIEQQVFDAVDEMAPYMSGRNDSFEVVISIRDRVPILGEIVKQKLNDEDILVKLVFEQVVDPLVTNLIADITILPFGIGITEDDVAEAVEIVAPAEWVRAQGDALIDVLIPWLTGESDDLTLTIDLRDRKTEAAVELEALAFRKLDEKIAATPVCATPFDVAAAGGQVLNGTFPDCLPQDTGIVIDGMRPLIAAELNRFVIGSVPDEVVYSDAMFRAQLGGSALDALDEVRRVVREGFVFTEQDLAGYIGGGGGQSDRIDIVRGGIRFDQSNLTNNMGPAQLAAFDSVRERIGLAWSLRWTVFAPAVLLLIAIAFIGGRRWRGRLMWGGGTVAVIAAGVFIAITAAWPATASLREFSLTDQAISAEIRADFPELTALLDSGALESKIEAIGTIWVGDFANSALPWAIAGLTVFAVAFLLPAYQHRLPGRLRGTGGGSPQPTRTDRDSWLIPEQSWPEKAGLGMPERRKHEGRSGAAA